MGDLASAGGGLNCVYTFQTLFLSPTGGGIRNSFSRAAMIAVIGGFSEIYCGRLGLQEKNSFKLCNYKYMCYEHTPYA